MKTNNTSIKGFKAVDFMREVRDKISMDIKDMNFEEIKQYMENRRLEAKLRRYPDAIQYLEPSVVSESIPEDYVALKDGFDQVREHVKSVHRNNSSSKK
jgi:hypothetical protein